LFLQILRNRPFQVVLRQIIERHEIVEAYREIADQEAAHGDVLLKGSGGTDPYDSEFSPPGLRFARLKVDVDGSVDLCEKDFDVVHADTGADHRYPLAFVASDLG